MITNVNVQIIMLLKMISVFIFLVINNVFNVLSEYVNNVMMDGKFKIIIVFQYVEME